MKKQEYAVVEAGSATELESLVRAKIEEGWIVTGGVAVAVMGVLNEDFFYQAMIKE